MVIPEDWKSFESGNYTVKFTLDQVNDQECKLLAIPSGDTLVVNLVLKNGQRKVFSMAFQTPKYVNIYSSDIAGRYLNLKEFSFAFKNGLSTPARCEILSEVGLTNSRLQGLSIEIKLKILGMLDARSLSRIAQTCREFRELAGDQKIWRRLLRRDFSVSRDLTYGEQRESYILLLDCKIRQSMKRRMTDCGFGSSQWRSYDFEHGYWPTFPESCCYPQIFPSRYRRGFL